MRAWLKSGLTGEKGREGGVSGLVHYTGRRSPSRVLICIDIGDLEEAMSLCPVSPPKPLITGYSDLSNLSIGRCSSLHTAASVARLLRPSDRDRFSPVCPDTLVCPAPSALLCRPHSFLAARIWVSPLSTELKLGGKANTRLPSTGTGLYYTTMDFYYTSQLDHLI